MTDIVERLKYQSGWTERVAIMGKTGDMLWDAIDEIERLRAALEPFAEVARWAERNGHDLLKGWDMLIRGEGAICHLHVQSPDFIKARRALEQNGNER